MSEKIHEICLNFMAGDDNDDNIIEDILVLMPTIFWGQTHPIPNGC